MQLCFPRKKSFSVLDAELILMRAFYNNQIATGDEMSRGRDSNTMLVSHSAEEFMLESLVENDDQAFH